MATQFSLTGKLAVISSVLLLLSLGLCGLGGSGLDVGRISEALVPAGVLCLGVGLLGLLVTAIVAIVQAVKGRKD